MRAGLIAVMTVATLGGGVASASADGAPTDDDAYTSFNPNETGLFELYGDSSAGGQIHPYNWSGDLSAWGPGNKESHHWADNDYTEVRFTGCTMAGTTGRSVSVKLWQAIPFGRDKDVGTKTFTACFGGGTSQGEWNVHYEGGDNRYFTLPQLNGSEYTRAQVSVRKIYVDTTKAD
ncbi:hypothetical protein ACFY93_34500 [Streptomyces sp. NPDC008313]|uniref:hypothetical protein n=1 Tax=Streptomyces sp. NPDC008313 TaxID=3364826 RepID=UPI0036E99548